MTSRLHLYPTVAKLTYIIITAFTNLFATVEEIFTRTGRLVFRFSTCFGTWQNLKIIFLLRRFNYRQMYEKICKR